MSNQAPPDGASARRNAGPKSGEPELELELELESEPVKTRESVAAGAGRVVPPARTAARPPRGRLGATPVRAPGLSDRLRRAWGRHTLVQFAGHRARITFYRQLLSLVKSGQGIPTSLVKLAQYAPDRRTRNAMREMQVDINAGATFGESMRKHADRFDDAIIELILFAEETGNLQRVLEQVIKNQEEVQALRWRALFSSLWPLYLIGAITFVGPLFGVARIAGTADRNWFGAYMSGLGGNLVWMTLILAIVLGGPFMLAALQLDGLWERITLMVPFIGRVKRDFIGAKFFLALGLGLGSGVEVKRATKIALSASGSPTMASQTGAVAARIENGSTLADALAPLAVFDRPSLGALAMGEETGTLDDQLRQLAADTQEAALRGARIVMLLVLVLIAVVALLSIVSALLGTLFGPVTDYMRMHETLVPDE